ncbi:8-oxo-dGTP pyrophosphatase MutT (NUDIX family) [Kitasatospora sp. MAP12-15]|uniref:NUDIX hydrolase n=1 Tax=unclassified Kitasatospora TaxID=2633591 RepID=UPI002476F37A|nr:NUDIX hydrolase [Kitasatospora sp. MAP12-44]MDH6109236.1 8-oxo-dGTP pyrophosphatase MutT (NUDIX family) [Kitasatospora sp. MAP12-44]
MPVRQKEAMSDSPYVPRVFPISVKGVVLDGEGRVLLLKNEREEWELPGGKLELGEEPAACVVREVHEESGWEIGAGPLLDVWMYEPVPGRHVFIVTYGCRRLGPETVPAVSNEHKEVGLFARDEVGSLVMPQGYKDSISRWYAYEGLI